MGKPEPSAAKVIQEIQPFDLPLSIPGSFLTLPDETCIFSPEIAQIPPFHDYRAI
jgi:hypothetical protein